VVKRKRSVKRNQADDDLAIRIAIIKENHPFWGYRRIWAWLRRREGIIVNDKRVYRVMKERSLLCPRKPMRKIADREPREKPRATRVNQFWGTDMTKIYVESFGWVYIVIVLDWFSKKVVGLDVDGRSRATEWLAALNQAVNARFPNGVREAGLRLISDNGCQPTSIAYQDYCGHTGIEQIYTSYSNPKGNGDTERFMRTMKEELLWLHEWKSLEEVKTALNTWIQEYNANYLHSAHDYRSPDELEGFIVRSAVA
jgi:putative transposase